MATSDNVITGNRMINTCNQSAGSIPIVRLSHVQESLKRLDEHIDVLHNNIDTLLNRLAAVLRDEPEPQSQSGGKPQDGGRVALSTAVEIHADRVRRAAEGLQDILDRIEL